MSVDALRARSSSRARWACESAGAPAFEAIASEIGVPLERILFFDDTRVNVEGALAIGMQAVLVRSIADVEQAVATL